MKVILKENIKSIGKKDEIINVSDGYARNYLFAKKLAVEATNSNLAKLKSKKESEQYKKDVEKEEAKKQADKMSKIRLKFKVKAGENGKVFGGVSSKEIAEKLEIVGSSDTKFKIIGNLQTSSYKKDDQKIYSMNVVVESFELLNE